MFEGRWLVIRNMPPNSTSSFMLCALQETSMLRSFQKTSAKPRAHSVEVTIGILTFYPMPWIVASYSYSMTRFIYQARQVSQEEIKARAPVSVMEGTFRGSRRPRPCVRCWEADSLISSRVISAMPGQEAPGAIVFHKYVGVFAVPCRALAQQSA